MQWRRLNLAEIGAALHRLSAVPRDELDPDHKDQPLEADTIRRLIAGYRYVDELLADRTDIARYGMTSHILELNHLVLCGTSPERREQFRSHIEETTRWFYDRAGEGIGAMFDWLQRNRTREPQPLAAGIFVQVVSTPQLFLEGNRRTAALLASYTLARAGLPPLVVIDSSYRRYADLSARCLAIQRAGLGGLVAIPLANRRMLSFLRDTADPRFLLAASQDFAASAGALA